jgi:hypothetical protein
MSTLADRLPRASGRALRRAHDARVKFWRVAIVSGFFAVVLGANLIIGGVLVVKALSSHSSQTTGYTRIGRVTFPMLDGVFCRRVLYDNKTGQTTTDKISRCDDHKARPQTSSKNFNWGGQ